MTFPVYCKDCKFSKPDSHSTWELRCHHPKVNASDPYALVSSTGNGSSCLEERKKSSFAVCGRLGKLWEQK